MGIVPKGALRGTSGARLGGCWAIDASVNKACVCATGCTDHHLQGQRHDLEAMPMACSISG